jgi:hypothetical protein
MADVRSRAGTRSALLAYLERLHAPHDPGLAGTFAAPGHEGPVRRSSSSATRRFHEQAARDFDYGVHPDGLLLGVKR